MRDYDELIERLRYCADRPICFSTQCDYRQTAHIGACFDSLKHDAADAIEELLAAEPPLLWTDEPIEGTEFMTHSQGGRKGFEIHFRTDSLEKYKAVQEECRRQIDHAKPAPPKEDSYD